MNDNNGYVNLIDFGKKYIELTGLFAVTLGLLIIYLGNNNTIDVGKLTYSLAASLCSTGFILVVIKRFEFDKLFMKHLDIQALKQQITQCHSHREKNIDIQRLLTIVSQCDLKKSISLEILKKDNITSDIYDKCYQNAKSLKISGLACKDFINNLHNEKSTLYRRLCEKNSLEEVKCIFMSPDSEFLKQKYTKENTVNSNELEELEKAQTVIKKCINKLNTINPSIYEGNVKIKHISDKDIHYTYFQAIPGITEDKVTLIIGLFDPGQTGLNSLAILLHIPHDDMVHQSVAHKFEDAFKDLFNNAANQTIFKTK